MEDSLGSIGYKIFPPDAFSFENELEANIFFASFTFFGKISGKEVVAAKFKKAAIAMPFIKAVEEYLPKREEIDDLKELASLGDVSAMQRVGCYYWSLLHPSEADVPRAMYWFEQAAECGSAWAQTTLAVLYAMELVPWKNHAESVKWALIAARGGDSVAQRMLLEWSKYFSEEDIQCARNEAYAWFERRKRP